jgi:hypothetical protein
MAKLSLRTPRAISLDLLYDVAAKDLNMDGFRNSKVIKTTGGKQSREIRNSEYSLEYQLISPVQSTFARYSTLARFDFEQIREEYRPLDEGAGWLL